MKFKHGERVTCTIEGEEIKDAKISINSSGVPYICQNVKNGADADDKLGYKYSWSIGKFFPNSSSVENLRPAVKSFDYPEIGDEYKAIAGHSQWVLGVCGRVILLSEYEGKDIFSGGYTKEELIESGYTIVQDEQEVKEMTVEEVSKLVGATVKIVEAK